MTHGDTDMVKCPACKKKIEKPFGRDAAEKVRSSGTLVALEKTSPCPHCKTELYFWARMACVVDCEKESRVK